MSGRKLSPGIADWLSLGAAPAFALIGLFTALAGASHTGVLCAEAGGASLLTGMAPMYLLMALFHLAPWFRRLAPRG